MKKFGHYEVTAELGRGGMGVVYKGFEPSLNRKVAIKCLAKHLLDDKDLVERFTREAKATAALNDPNVIQIYYIGEEEGQPFFAMEYIEGRSLDDLLKGGNTLSVSHAKNILKQACSGLEAAHKIGLVHRDIKPANMMITNDGILKIVDFGIARTREYGDKLTNTGEFVGTPGYLSPEVCIGKEVDARSDIFSLGIVFYEMLAGKVPFENDSPLGLMLEVVQSEIPDIRTLNNKVDKKTSYILNKMIAKSPDERYQSCSDIIRDLGNTIDNQDIKAIQSESKVVKHTVTKKKISEQITLPGVATVTSNQLVTTQQKQPG
ncbi:MAG: serine/threonine protein kinase, partial [Xanthomonadales bacterium]|nr:serine/threonine protein kinase [Xanthomonadales bacterium]